MRKWVAVWIDRAFALHRLVPEALSDTIVGKENLKYLLKCSVIECVHKYGMG